MQQQALYAAQHKKCKYSVNVSVSVEGGIPLQIGIVEFQGHTIKKYKLYTVHTNKATEFNEAIKAINGEIDPFKEI